MPKHAMKGVLDISLVKRGQFVGLEVKTVIAGCHRTGLNSGRASRLLPASAP
jgi:hypothetical protein